MSVSEVRGGLAPGTVVAGVLRVWTDARRVERVAYAVGGLLLLSGVFHLGVFAVDGGPWEGPVSWRKAVTFGLSFGLTLITIAWVASYVPLRDRTRGIVLGVFTADCVAEVALITTQAWRRVPSHFNMETPLDTTISRLLAVGGGILIATLVTLAIASFRENPEVAPSMRLAVRVGFVALMLALASGAAMIARGVMEVQTGHQQLAYHVAGALKPAHAVTMHAILVLPALAWALALTGLPETRRTRVVAIASWAYAAAAGVVIAVSVVNFATA